MRKAQHLAAPGTRDTSPEERVVGMVLRIGAYSCIALIVLGGALVLAGVKHTGWRIVEAGLLVLMSTPMTRVLTAGVVFWRQGDRRYALVSVGVLLILIATSLLGAFRVLPGQ
ncbi:MAG: DUF1634 domain-containing protein [Terriglobales bacterium]